METAVQNLFDRYARLTAQALAGHVDTGALATLYAPEFIAAAPAGVSAGRNDQTLVQAMIAGFDHYRRIGTQDMVIRDLSLTRLDDLHGVVRVGWRATYARADLPE
ncbi:MAG: nuclear transport factor 2 family protein, partial [Paracoccus sp. (in: a-proteobacteria)]|nr:nuclear transport factor 2 family protein [Paracoccus sp. (in: a-proteobacteria)]